MVLICFSYRSFLEIAHLGKKSTFAVWDECSFNDGLGLPSKAFKRVDTQTYEEGTIISCGQFFLDRLPPFFIYSIYPKASSYHFTYC